MEMGKQLSAQAMVMGLAIAGLYAAFGEPGDDEEWDYELRRSSPNFGKVRVGKTWFDVTAGLGQHVSYMSRIASGKSYGRWEDEEVEWTRLLWTYARGKLAPLPSMIVDARAGQSLGREEFGTLGWVRDSVVPLQIQEVYEAFENEGVPLATVIALSTFFGIGAQTYEERVNARKDAANEIRAARKQGKPDNVIKGLLDRHFSHQASLAAKQALRTADAGDAEYYQKIVDEVPSAALADAMEKERGDLALFAATMLSSEDPRTEKKSPASDPAITAARNLLKAMAPTYEEANAIYTDGYRTRNGSVTELVGGRYRTKQNVIAARRRLRSLYADQN